METTKDLFKHLEEAENLFSTGKIKNAQKILKSVIKISRDMNKIPNINISCYIIIILPVSITFFTK